METIHHESSKVIQGKGFDMPQACDHGQYALYKVTFCGYNISHPSDDRVNIRVQTTCDPAREVLKDACQNFMVVCHHVRNTFDKAVLDFKPTNPVGNININ
ncbi:DNA-directed RNA polymerases I and III subunit RPAC2-like [Cucurbita maxima]|uniref:DNA-directed RNA polymerases I and III subunit RPAC2-like n=1 Tax=Cucurbita maxima TaxID=3661 RepID=A0A6J1HYX9_CUCMA|nr:DNA-directed RNA polymerases I and III subunit RPAC2-like [Cucurbita maxima]